MSLVSHPVVLVFNPVRTVGLVFHHVRTVGLVLYHVRTMGLVFHSARPMGLVFQWIQLHMNANNRKAIEDCSFTLELTTALLYLDYLPFNATLVTIMIHNYK